MEQLIINDITINSPGCFFPQLILSGIIIRIISALMRAYEANGKIGKGFGKYFFKSFTGKSTGNNHNEKIIEGDHLFTFWLGLIELFMYSFLISAGLWMGIVLWLSLKTLPQWGHWNEKRSVFNRFLIANALVIMVALFCLSTYIKIDFKKNTDIKKTEKIIEQTRKGD